MNNAADQTSPREIVVLETYPSKEAAYDGLSGLFNEVRPVGPIVPDTSHLSGASVLVCGIPTLYQERITARNTNMIFTTFESDNLPQEWITAINQYQYCIVPHEAVKQMYLNAGIRIPVSVVHNGYRRYPRKKRTLDNQHFHVGFLGIPVTRKNLDKLYEACKELQQTNIPELKLHIHVASFYDWLDTRPFEEMQKAPFVSWTTGKHDADWVSDWYHRLSCYIFPSSGEGWSYTPRESMYLAVPTIISNIPTHRELAESGFCKVIPSAGRETANFNGSIHGTWDLITAAGIKDAITDVYNRRQHFETLAGAGAEWIENKWRNEEISRDIIQLMHTL
ncbi:glycosyltransferase [Chitinophaga varians]|uniref:glycosyltransferase n=1 Tax=Chitinophaga varians TaxID=2202339 RepID=UPI00165F7FB2|nr:glycosyltransferase [Chitinophaga varians]MBC9913411.1 glycosyltransferase family 4 protein [Chitinophaga varians]